MLLADKSDVCAYIGGQCGTYILTRVGVGYSFERRNEGQRRFPGERLYQLVGEDIQ